MGGGDFWNVFWMVGMVRHVWAERLGAVRSVVPITPVRARDDMWDDEIREMEGLTNGVTKKDGIVPSYG